MASAGRKTIEERRMMIESAKEIILAFRTRRRIIAAFCERHGVQPRAAHSWVKKAYDDWEKEAAREGGQTHARREKARETLEDIIFRAMNRRKLDPEGNEMRDEKGRHRLDPDLRTALRAVQTLSKLDALEQPRRVEASLSGEVTHQHENLASLMASLDDEEEPAAAEEADDEAREDDAD